MDVSLSPHDSSISSSLLELLKAYQCACRYQLGEWEFAVDIQTLQSFGLTATDIRELIRAGALAHAEEITRPDDERRQFRSIKSLYLCDRTCFILTGKGLELAAGCHRASPPLVSPELPRLALPELPAASPCRLAPIWDPERRELRYQRDLVKQFRWQAMNQEMILAAFQEEDWPARIDDPLPPQADQDPKRRLHDAIKGLNRYQDEPLILIRFRGDGTGEGVIWETLEP